MTQSTTPTGSRLSRATILDAYIRLADMEGPEAVSLRRLGAALGVDATAVYRHFRDKDALLEAVADRLLAELADRHERRDHWRDDIRQLAIEGRRMYLGHSRLAGVIASSPEPLPGNARLTEIILGDLRAAGLPDSEVALAYETIVTYVAGGSSLDAVAGTASGASWRSRFASLDPDRFPHSVAVSEHLYRDDEVTFEFGLDLILDALEARVAGR